MSDWNKMLIAQLRSSGGQVAAGPMAGRTLLILTTTGARSGEPRESVLTYSRDGEAYVVAATANGAPKDPGWFHNLVRNPEVQVEAGGVAFKARASVADEAERVRLWNDHVAGHPEFAGYPEKTGRVIPMITLEPVPAR